MSADHDEVPDGEGTGRHSVHAQESWASGPFGQLGLSTTRVGEANSGSASSAHPVRTAFIALAVVVVVIVALVLLFAYL